ncbi:hypothetical protein [Pseudomonas sp. NFACC08-1]|nr:hypothetical protein [Pseudomonas sp. NFACC08-1]
MNEVRLFEQACFSVSAESKKKIGKLNNGQFAGEANNKEDHE